MIKIVPSGDYVQLKYVDTLGEYVQEELKSDADAIEYSSDSSGKIYLKFGRMTFDYFDPTEFEIDGSTVTDASDFITKLTALFFGAGVGNTIYTGDGSLAGDRTLDLNGHDLTFTLTANNKFIVQDALYSWLILNKTIGGEKAQLTANNDNTGFAEFTAFADGDPSYRAQITAVDPSSIQVDIVLNATTNTITHTADTHTFNGQIITPDLIAKDFADDGAAATGGIAVGQWYHTSGTFKIRLI